MNLFFDTETTGLPGDVPLDSPAYPWPVEVAGILATSTGSMVSSFRMVIKPDGWTISDDVVKIHGIDTGYAAKFGMDLALALSVVAAFAQQATTALAWNVSFDYQIIESAALRLKMPNPLQDVPLKDVMSETSNCLGLGRMSLAKAYDWMFKQPVPAAHTALGGARACQSIWRKINEKHELPG